MISQIGILDYASKLAVHSMNRQSVIAENVANADTPGYKAKDLKDFSVNRVSSGTEMYQTRSGHMTSTPGFNSKAIIVDNGPISPNGNSVSLETEMVKSTEATRSHSLALTIYKSSLDALRASLGTR